jgi:hypothetical protein
MVVRGYERHRRGTSTVIVVFVLLNVAFALSSLVAYMLWEMFGVRMRPTRTVSIAVRGVDYNGLGYGGLNYQGVEEPAWGADVAAVDTLKKNETEGIQLGGNVTGVRDSGFERA